MSPGLKMITRKMNEHERENVGGEFKHRQKAQTVRDLALSGGS